MSQDFGIAEGAKRVSFELKLSAQVFVIVNLAILKADDLTPSAGERLPTMFEIDDCQSAHGHPDTAVDKLSHTIGATPGHDIAHCT
jgi:hypothetical protein